MWSCLGSVAWSRQFWLYSNHGPSAMETKFTAYLLHKILEQTDMNLGFSVSIRKRPSKKPYKSSIFKTNLVNSYRIMFDFSCLLSERSRVRIAPGRPKGITRPRDGLFLLFTLVWWFERIIACRGGHEKTLGFQGFFLYHYSSLYAQISIKKCHLWINFYKNLTI